MRNGKRGRYTLEFKQEAVRLVESGQSLEAAARSLGVVEQTLSNSAKAQHGTRASTSRKGNCWVNAPTETLFGSMKVERLHGRRFSTIRQAKDETLAWFIWYNRQRMHSTLNHASPVEFESNWDRMNEAAA